MTINSKQKADLLALFNNLPLSEPNLIIAIKDILEQTDANQISITDQPTNDEMKEAIQILRTYIDDNLDRSTEVDDKDDAVKELITALTNSTYSQTAVDGLLVAEATARNNAITAGKTSLTRIFELTTGTLSNTPGSSDILAGNLFSDFDEILFVVFLNNNGFHATTMPGDLVIPGVRIGISDQSQFLEIDIDSDNTLSRHNSNRAYLPFYIYGKKY